MIAVPPRESATAGPEAGSPESVVGASKEPETVREARTRSPSTHAASTPLPRPTASAGGSGPGTVRRGGRTAHDPPRAGRAATRTR